MVFEWQGEVIGIVPEEFGFKKVLKQREPAPLHEMDKTRWEGHHSICQTIRDIYHMTDDDVLKMKCRVALAMTKAMHEKLKWYKAKESEEPK